MRRHRRARDRILQAKVLHARHDYDGEWRLLQEAAPFAPNDPVLAWAAVDLGYIYFSNGRWPEAASRLEWAMNVSPTMAQGFDLLARTYDELGQPERAAAARKQAMALR